MIDRSKKTIIFDFGNVLINLNFERFFKAFEDIFDKDWSSSKIPDSIISAIHKFDRGQISDESLIWAFQNLKASAEPRRIISAWNSLIDDMPKKRFDLLVNLKESYNLCILSNINNLHINKISKYFKKEFNLEDFEDRYFDSVFYSHIIGMRKPDEEIYSFVTKSLNVNPQDVLFIDDMVENIDAAKAYGWKGCVHRPGEEIIDKIDTYLEISDFK